MGKLRLAEVGALPSKQSKIKVKSQEMRLLKQGMKALRSRVNQEFVESASVKKRKMSWENLFALAIALVRCGTFT